MLVLSNFEITVYDQFVISGNPALLKCHIANNDLKDLIRVVSWLRDDGIVITSSVFTEPHRAVPARITESLTSIRGFEGETLFLPCLSQGFPVPKNVWFKRQNGNYQMSSPVLVSNDARTTVLENTGVLIEKAMILHSGRYSCHVNNSVGKDTIETELKVYATLSAFIEPETQIVDVGNQAVFRCRILGHPVKSVTWLKNGKAVKMGARINLISRDILRIESVQREDKGMFQCIIGNDIETAQGAGQLDIGGPPSIRSMPNVTALSNQKVFVHCSYSGFPIKSISWIRDGRRLPQNHRQKVFANGTLVISEVERSADEGRYECVVTNEEGRIAKRDVFISVIVSPIVEPFSFPNDLVAGRRAGVACIVSSGDLPMNITWLKDGLPLPKSLGAVTRAHNGNYTCEAENPAHKSNYTATMIVQVPPSWIIEPKDKSVVKGQGIRFDCQADGFPLPIIRWKKAIDGEDFKVVISNANIQTLENGSLTIREASRMDAGHYMCQAINGVGPGASTVVRLTVNGIKKFEAQTVKKGDDVSLHCKAIGERIIKISWTKDRQPINANNEPRPNLCSNVHTEPPDCPSDLKASELGSRLITLIWSHPYSGNSPITNYIIEYKPKGLFKNANLRTYKETVESSATTHVIKALEPQSEYMVTVIAQNNIGQSSGCVPIVVQTDSEAPTVAPRNVKAVPLSSNSIEVSWKKPIENEGDKTSIILGYYIGYRLHGSTDDFSYKTEEAKDNGAKGEYHCVITGLRKLSRYTITVQAYNKKGAGPSSDEVDAQTLEFDPPDPPSLKVISATTASVYLAWESNDADSADPLTGYILFHKSELSDWEEIPIYADRLNYNLSNLQCGRKYQFYIIAFNSAGKGQPSEVVPARTEGSEAEYVFATLTATGEPIQSYSSETLDDFANQLKMAMPLISTLLVLLLILATVFAMFKRRQTFTGEPMPGECNNYEVGKSCEAVALNEWDNCSKRVSFNQANEETQRRLSMSNLGKANEQIYFPSPYALSRVSMYEQQNGHNVSNSHLQQSQSHHYDVPFKKCLNVGNDVNQMPSNSINQMVNFNHPQNANERHYERLDFAKDSRRIVELDKYVLCSSSLYTKPRKKSELCDVKSSNDMLHF
ncbi:Down syndrome cell adhesion molecule-like protein, partial [Dinothrombium tinctorium]